MNQTIKISDDDVELELNYQQALDFHNGDSIWGVAVAFRMLQLAARFFNDNRIWKRNDLYIVSGHPGPGVKDAIEFVTHCISNEQFTLQKGCEGKGCSRNMKFEWSITNNDVTCIIKLRDDFVPEEFYAVLDRLNTGQEQESDKNLFEKFKQDLSEKIWQESISNTFRIIIDTVNINKNKSAHA
tara:strand:- start:2724 stop:3275 length:552 start_codon:yes stop_codon:yes gene_type:complete